MGWGGERTLRETCSSLASSRVTGEKRESSKSRAPRAFYDCTIQGRYGKNVTNAAP